MQETTLGAILDQPKKIMDYYQSAIKQPKEFSLSINYNEDLKDTGIVLFVAIIIVSIANFILSFASPFGAQPISALVTSIIMLSICMPIAGGVTYLICKFAGGTADYTQSLNLCIHSFILLLPISLISSLFMPLHLVVIALQILFFMYVLLNKFNAEKTKTFIVCGVFVVLLIIPLACSMMVAPLLKSSGLAAFGGDPGTLNAVTKANSARVPCMDDYEDSDNLYWKNINLTSFMGLILSAKNGKQDEAARAIILQIDKVLEADHGMPQDQAGCMAEFRDSLENTFF